MTSTIIVLDHTGERGKRPDYRSYLPYLALDAFQDYIILGDTTKYPKEPIVSICIPVRLSALCEHYNYILSHKSRFTYSDGGGVNNTIEERMLLDDNKKVYI